MRFSGGSANSFRLDPLKPWWYPAAVFVCSIATYCSSLCRLPSAGTMTARERYDVLAVLVWLLFQRENMEVSIRLCALLQCDLSACAPTHNGNRELSLEPSPTVILPWLSYLSSSPPHSSHITYLISPLLRIFQSGSACYRAVVWPLVEDLGHSIPSSAHPRRSGQNSGRPVISYFDRSSRTATASLPELLLRLLVRCSSDSELQSAANPSALARADWITSPSVTSQIPLSPSYQSWHPSTRKAARLQVRQRLDRRRSPTHA